MSHEQHESEETLIVAAQSGDRGALGRLLLRHADALARRLAARLPRTLARVASVDDLLQQTYAEAFQDIGRFELRGSGSFFAWLDTIAQRRLQNMIKSVGRLKRGGGAGQFDPPAAAETSVRDLLAQVAGREGTASQNVTQQEAIMQLNVAIADLPDDYRKVLRWRYLEGLPVDEIADRMGRTSAAIRAIIDRAKHRLRNTMGNLSSQS